MKTTKNAYLAKLTEQIQMKSVKVGKKNIYELTCLSIKDMIEFLENIKLTEFQEQVAKLLLVEIKNRLLSRSTETKEQIIERFKLAYQEVNEVSNYNYVVVNDDIDDCVNKVNSIIISNKLRVDRIEELSVENQEEFMHELLMDKDFQNIKLDYGE